MADDRYGYGRREGRERGGSIFSDDDERGSDRWSSDYRRTGRDDERGFFDRAGDEVRAWFGDDEAERRRERDQRETRSAIGGRDRDDGRFRSRGHDRDDESRLGGLRSGQGLTASTVGRGDWEHGGRERAGWGSGLGGGQSPYSGGNVTAFGGSTREPEGRSSFGRGRSHWDDHYQQWRERQIQQFDQEYDDYCRERQQRFEQDFDTWRSSRLTEGSGGGASAAGFGGETGTAQAGTTGTGTAGETGGTASETGEAGRGRGRSRT